MAEYIRQEAIINRIKEYALDVYGIDLDNSLRIAGKSVDDRICEGLYEAIELINEIPSEDVVLEMRGRWVHLGGMSGVALRVALSLPLREAGISLLKNTARIVEQKWNRRSGE